MQLHKQISFYTNNHQCIMQYVPMQLKNNSFVSYLSSLVWSEGFKMIL